MIKLIHNKYLLSIISGLILSLAWTQFEIGWIAFVAFVPILMILEDLLKSNSKSSAAAFAGYTFISFFIWNLLSTWWVFYSTIPGAITSIILTSVFMSAVMFISFTIFKHFGRRLGYLVFITNWIAFEYLLLNSQLAWTWMILGNSFVNNISLIQWYEYLGHFGGTAWVLIVNIFIYELIRSLKNRKSVKAIRNIMFAIVAAVFLPILFSLLRYNSYVEKDWPVDIVIIQPNVDPYNSKFSDPIREQLKIIIELADSSADEKVDYFVAPETAIPNGMWERSMNENPSIILLRAFLQNYPNSRFVIGADTRLRYKNAKGKSKTAVRLGETEDFFDIYNTSMQLDTSSEIQLYHKSKLVSGVETIPYPMFLGLFPDLTIDLGGMSGSRGTQECRSVFLHDEININIGVPICYESDFGEFNTEFVAEGANLLFVITNDAWWGDTPGYKRHRDIARIRAVETRRSIARSANTGISCFINQRGDVVNEITWWKRGAIRGKLNANDKLTFYVIYGDFIARMALVISILIIIVQGLNIILKRIKPNSNNCDI